MCSNNFILFFILLLVGGNALSELLHEYFFHPTQDVTWEIAGRYCRNKNMQPLSIESEEEFQYIKNYLSTNFDERREFWTSGLDLMINSTAGDDGQVWSDIGTKIESHYWAQNEPNDLNNTIPEICVSFRYENSTSFMLNDQVCSSMLGAICRKTMDNYINVAHG